VRGVVSLTYLFAAIGMSLAWILQLAFVFPLEEILRPEGANLRAFSLLFLPHGAKVLVVMFLMGGGAPLIMLLSFIFGLFWHPPEYAFIGGIIAGVTAIIPLWGINLAVGKPLNYRFFSYTRDNFNLFKFAMVMNVAIALLNSFFQSLHAKQSLDINPEPLLALGFLIGDILGGLVCIMLGILAARAYLKRYQDAF